MRSLWRPLFFHSNSDDTSKDLWSCKFFGRRKAPFFCAGHSWPAPSGASLMQCRKIASGKFFGARFLFVLCMVISVVQCRSRCRNIASGL